MPFAQCGPWSVLFLPPRVPFPVPSLSENSSSSFKTQPAFTSSRKPSLTLGLHVFLSVCTTRYEGLLGPLFGSAGVRAPQEDTAVVLTC